MVASGLLVGSPGAYRSTVAVQGMIVPPSIQSVLASRIDRLSPLQKQIVGCAAVIGDEVPYTILENMTAASQLTLRRAVDVLQTEGILVQTSNASRTEYSFRQSFMREVACRTLLNCQREALLARVANMAKSG